MGAPSGDNSSNRIFYRVLALVVAVLGAGILVLSLLVTTSGPRVRQVVVQNRGESGDGVSIVDQGLTLVFDRPVEKTNFEEAIEIRPKAAHTVTHSSQQISIAFDQNLLSGTEYTLTVAPKLRDGLGEPMARPYEHEFSTAEPAFTYLERNYGSGEMDRIIEISPLSGESRTLFFADAIEYFARNDDHLAVVLPRTEYTDQLRVVNLGAGGAEEVGVPGAARIDSLSFSPVGDQLIFVTRVLAGPGAAESFRKGYNNKLYSYDVEAGRLSPVNTLSHEGNVESASFSRDGQTLLYGTPAGEYFLTGAAEDPDTEAIPLGEYTGAGGFDRTNTRIVFQTNEGAVVYDARTRRLRGLPRLGADGRSSTPTFLYNSDKLVFRQSVYDPETGENTSQVVTIDQAGSAEAQVESPPGTYFFDDTAVSYDDRYILVEAAPYSASMDFYPSNPQPEGARLLLYDRFEREVLDEVRGIEPVWSS